MDARCRSFENSFGNPKRFAVNEISAQHWLITLSFALSLHIAAAVAFLQDPVPAKRAFGGRGVEITLGPAVEVDHSASHNSTQSEETIKKLTAKKNLPVPDPAEPIQAVELPMPQLSNVAKLPKLQPHSKQQSSQRATAGTQDKTEFSWPGGFDDIHVEGQVITEGELEDEWLYEEGEVVEFDDIDVEGQVITEGELEDEWLYEEGETQEFDDIDVEGQVITEGELEDLYLYEGE